MCSEVVAAYFEYPVFRFRRNQHRAPAVMTSVAMPSPSAIVPIVCV